MDKGCLGVPHLSFHLGRKCLAPPPGWSISQWDFISQAVGHNGPLTEDIYLEEGWVVENIKMTAPPGF